MKKIIMQLIKGAKLEYFQHHELQHLANAMGKGGGGGGNVELFKQSKPAEE